MFFIKSVSFPEVKHLAEQVPIPFEASEDKHVWKNSSNMDLSFKEAFEFKYGTRQNINWAKVILSPDIPPSKSLFVWRLMHNKVPTDDNLMTRGKVILSPDIPPSKSFSIYVILLQFSV